MRPTQLDRGDGPAAQKHAEEAMALTEEFGLPSLSAMATTVHGAALIAQGRYEEGIAGMRRGISAFRATGGTPYAWICAFWPPGSEGSDGPRKDLRCWRRDLLPSRRPGSRSPVRGCITSKVSCCWRRTRRTLPKRSYVSARRSKSPGGKVRDQRSCVPRRASPDCSTKQGHRDEARAMLAEIYGWFTEGFDTADLKDARRCSTNWTSSGKHRHDLREVQNGKP